MSRKLKIKWFVEVVGVCLPAKPSVVAGEVMIGIKLSAVIQNEEASLETYHFVRVLCDLCHVGNRSFPDTKS